MKKLTIIALSIILFSCGNLGNKKDQESKMVTKYTIDQFYKNLSIYG